MRPPSRLRRIVKWTGSGLSLLILATGFATLWCGAKTMVANRWMVATHSGNIFIVTNADPAMATPHFFTKTRNNWGLSSPAVEFPTYLVKGLRQTIVRVPYWLLLLVASIPTAWLWHRDRRSRRLRPGCCVRCGYDLTGNTTGVCSECGEKTATAKRELIGEGRK